MATDDSPELTIRVLKSGTCQSLSGKAKLTYQVGCDNEANLAVRVATNTGGGFFSDEWVPLTAIDKVVQSPAAKKGLTSTAFRSIFKGKSVNTAGFLLAVLSHERAVRRQEGKSRLYEVADYDTFRAGLHGAMRAVSEKAAKAGGRATVPAKKGIQKSTARRG
jgi:hypothetical protein